MNQTNSSYYLWKWADNDLPGKPNEVYSELLHGKMHPALQTFNPAPVVHQLERIAAQGRPKGEEWDWQIHKDPSGRQAASIFLTCPNVRGCGKMCQKFCQQLLRLDISGYDEAYGQLIDYFPPKKNYWKCFETNIPAYDITEDDLPELLHRDHESAPILYDRRNNFVQCCGYRRRFMVEWQELYDLADPDRCSQWRAGYLDPVLGKRRRFATMQLHANRLNSAFEWIGQPSTSRSVQELILHHDALRILRAFLRGEPRPAQYSWLDITAEVQ